MVKAMNSSSGRAGALLPGHHVGDGRRQHREEKAHELNRTGHRLDGQQVVVHGILSWGYVTPGGDVDSPPKKPSMPIPSAREVGKKSPYRNSMAGGRLVDKKTLGVHRHAEGGKLFPKQAGRAESADLHAFA